MKPRTQLEKDLQRAIDNGKLTPLTKKQMEQAHIIWDTPENKKYKMMLFTTTQFHDGMTLTKCYKAHQIGRRGMFTAYHLCVVKAERNGMTAFAARNCGEGYWIDNFSKNGRISIKDERYWYDTYYDGGFPLRSIGKADKYSVVRNYNHNTYEFRDNRIETLAKIGREDFIRLMMQTERAMSNKVYAALKIAMRHHYDFEKQELWRWAELVELLILNGYDYRNPHYICPGNLTQAYYKMADINDKRLQAKWDKKIEAQRKAAEEEARQRAIQKAKEDADDEKKYIKRLKKYLGMVITDGDIVIKPLQNVAEFKEEGERMHHCVYSCGYYKKAGVLVFSAKDLNGKRLATIEYNLYKHKIIQCRAACNKQPEQHDLICDLINEAMHQKTERAAA